MYNLSTPAAEKLHTEMRKLWEDHIIWTRNVICCLVDGLLGSDQALKRLMQIKMILAQSVPVSRL